MTAGWGNEALNYDTSEDDIAGRKVGDIGTGYDIEGICSTMPHIGDDLRIIPHILIVARKGVKWRKVSGHILVK